MPSTSPDQSATKTPKPKTELLSLDSPEGSAELRSFCAALLDLNHDLNNPLAGVIGYLELAMSREDDLTSKSMEMLGHVQASADKMNTLIQEFTVAKRRLQSTVDISSLLHKDDPANNDSEL